MCVAEVTQAKRVQFALGPPAKGSSDAQPLLQQLAVGTIVTLRGLKSRQELNGQSATIVKLKEASGRYAVKLQMTGEVIALRPEALEAKATTHNGSEGRVPVPSGSEGSSGSSGDESSPGASESIPEGLPEGFISGWQDVLVLMLVCLMDVATTLMLIPVSPFFFGQRWWLSLMVVYFGTRPNFTLKLMGWGTPTPTGKLADSFASVCVLCTAYWYVSNHEPGWNEPAPEYRNMFA